MITSPGRDTIQSGAILDVQIHASHRTVREVRLLRASLARLRAETEKQRKPKE